MKSRIGITMMIIGAVLVIGALSLSVYNVYDDSRAGKQSKEILTELENKLLEEGIEYEDYEFSDEIMRRLDGYIDSRKKAQSITLNGNNYIGIITIPSIGIELPVMEYWSYDNLAAAPCRYFGDAENGNFIIAAHNYNSHFGGIKNLVSGDEVIFTDTLGKRFHYKVAEKEIISGNDANAMTANDWALSLFTCTFDGSDRVTVRCDRKK